MHPWAEQYLQRFAPHSLPNNSRDSSSTHAWLLPQLKRRTDSLPALSEEELTEIKNASKSALHFLFGISKSSDGEVNAQVSGSVQQKTDNFPSHKPVTASSSSTIRPLILSKDEAHSRFQAVVKQQIHQLRSLSSEVPTASPSLSASAVDEAPLSRLLSSVKAVLTEALDYGRAASQYEAHRAQAPTPGAGGARAATPTVERAGQHMCAVLLSPAVHKDYRRALWSALSQQHALLLRRFDCLARQELEELQRNGGGESFATRYGAPPEELRRALFSFSKDTVEFRSPSASSTSYAAGMLFDNNSDNLSAYAAQLSSRVVVRPPTHGAHFAITHPHPRQLRTALGERPRTNLFVEREERKKDANKEGGTTVTGCNSFVDELWLLLSRMTQLRIVLSCLLSAEVTLHVCAEAARQSPLPTSSATAAGRSTAAHDEHRVAAFTVLRYLRAHKLEHFLSPSAHGPRFLRKHYFFEAPTGEQPATVPSPSDTSSYVSVQQVYSALVRHLKVMGDERERLWSTRQAPASQSAATLVDSHTKGRNVLPVFSCHVEKGKTHDQNPSTADRSDVDEVTLTCRSTTGALPYLHFTSADTDGFPRLMAPTQVAALLASQSVEKAKHAVFPNYSGITKNVLEELKEQLRTFSRCTRVYPHTVAVTSQGVSQRFPLVPRNDGASLDARRRLREINRKIKSETVVHFTLRRLQKR